MRGAAIHEPLGRAYLLNWLTEGELHGYSRGGERDNLGLMLSICSYEGSLGFPVLLIYQPHGYPRAISTKRPFFPISIPVMHRHKKFSVL
jgi:hypothetical protein